MRWDLATCGVRPLRPDDAPSLAAHADNHAIWRNLRDRFPHPYTEDDATGFIAAARAADPPTTFGIEVEGAVAGTVGFTLQTDVERCSAEIGYWLGEAFWGRGILTEVLRAVTPWAFDAYSLSRVFALPYADNAASRRVLEKAGYHLEGILRRSAVKGGESKDQALYGFVRDPADDPPGFLDGHGP